MSNKAIRRTTCAALTATLTLLSGNAGAADLDLATVPLFVKTDVPPNIMFLIDTSGSMNNIVPDDPYDATDSTYNTCPSNLSLGDPADINGFDQIDVYIQSDGDAYIRVVQSGTDPYYDWSNDTTGGNTGITGRDKACFDPNQSYEARLYANDGNDGSTKDPGGYLEAEYSGHYLNWYFSGNFGANARNKPGTERRMDIAQEAATALIPDLDNARVGLASYNGADGAIINVGVADNDAGSAHRGALEDAIGALTASGSTPLAESLHDIGRYFVGESGTQYNGNLTLHPNSDSPTTRDDDTVFNHSPDYASGVSSESPIQNYCQQNFAILLTDGRPQSDTGIDSSTGLTDYDGDCVGASPACLSDDRKPNQTYESSGSDYLDDVAQALYEMDLRPDLDGTDENGDPVEVTNNISTYTIGFADDQVINDPLMQDTADNGGGTFFAASDSDELVQAFKDATDDIYERTKSSATSVSFNVGSISSGVQAFQALFDSNAWTGQLLAYNLHDGTGNDTCNASDPIGTVCTPPEWDASCVLTGGTCEATTSTVSQNPTPANRKLITYDAVGKTGVALQWTDLTTAQQATLNTAPDGTTDTNGGGRLNYLRGVTDLEQSNGGSFRNRASLLGDIAHSSPVYVGPPARFFPLTWKDNLNGPTPESSYDTFRSANSTRTGVTYVGANDALLHGFRGGRIVNGSVTGSDGVELLGFMPSQAFDQATRLTDPDYSHRFYVDGPLVEADVFYSTWHTVLMGGLGRGGQGMFALDVTNPNNFSENNASTLALWEFTDADDDDLGYTMGKGAVVRLHNGKWAAVFGNGYNNTEADGSASASGNAVLYVLPLEGTQNNWQSGINFYKLDTGEGASDDPLGQDRPNGLASIFPVDKDGDFITDYVYAADLFGNIWRFDLTSDTESNWAVADFGTGSPTPLFTAVDGGGTRQPITTRVVANKHPNGVDHGVMVFFGTGKFLENGDEVPNTSITHTFYGIWDKDFSGVGATIDVNASLNTLTKHGFSRSDLQVQEIDAEDTESGNTFRRVTNNTIDWATQHGWYLDLKLSGGSNEGEMVIADPELRGGAAIFTTFIPEQSECDPGGTGWLFVIDQATGGRFDSSPFDVDGNNDFTTDDLIDFGDDGDEAAGAVKLEDGSGGQSTVYAGDGKDVVVTGINPDVTLIDSHGKSEGRRTWRQLR